LCLLASVIISNSDAEGYSIYDMSGRDVQNGLLNDQMLIPLNLPKGLYIITLSSNNKINYTSKLIIDE